MDSISYIQAILPLKLEWEPWYKTGAEVAVGQRVRVKLAGREYVAVVSRVCDKPDIDPKGVKAIEEVEDTLESIGADELRFWRFISDYYMCTIGEVYKAAYPKGKTDVEAKKARTKAADDTEIARKRLSEDDKRCVKEILEHFSQRKSVLLQSWEREAIYAELARRTAADGRDVLFLRPGAARESYVHQRESAKAVRSTSPAVIDGHRANLFLPWRKLGLVIVDEEHSAAFKQSTIAPRYNARDAALVLAQMHGADVILGSAVPSLESLYNASSGKFAQVRAADCAGSGNEIETVDTSAEIRKNGMLGSYSRKLVARMQETFDRGERVLLMLPWKNTDDFEIEARGLFPQARTKLQVKPLGEEKDFSKYGLVALLRADRLLSGGDFRSDEKMLRTISILRHEAGEKLLIQGSEIESRLPGEGTLARLLEERREFSLPPFSRLVEISVSDSNEPRLEKLSRELGSTISGCALKMQGPFSPAQGQRMFQLILPKDATLESRKLRIKKLVSDFQINKKYTDHIILDADPM